jgi:hypothetical protein
MFTSYAKGCNRFFGVQLKFLGLIVRYENVYYFARTLRAVLRLRER